VLGIIASQIVDVSSEATDVPNGCEKQIRLTPFDGKGGNELKQIVGLRHGKRESLIGF